MSLPNYVTTSRGQVRFFVGGIGSTVVALAGPTQAASCLSSELEELLPGRRVIVVEPPGIGGSARAEVSSIEERADVLAEALNFLDGETVDLIAVNLSVALVPDLSASLTVRNTVLVDVDSACDWVDSGINPPSPLPRDDGTHLIALWSFLRDRRLLRPDAPTLPRTVGPPLPEIRDLSASFVAAVSRPKAFVDNWHSAVAELHPALDAMSDSPRVSSIEELSTVLPANSPVVAYQSLPPQTTAAPTNELWHQYLETAFGLVHLRRAGQHGRPVMVLPTGGGSSAQFEPVVRGLATNRSVVAIDYFGNGLSDPLGRVPDVADLAREAMAVADALGWDTFDVWGSHTGACVALEMTILFPERIGRGVYEGPVMVSSEFRDDLISHYFPDLSPDGFGSHLSKVWNWRRDVFLYWPWYRVEHSAARDIGLPSAEDLQKYVVGILESGATYAGAYCAAFGYDTKARLSHLARPAIITAGPHDMLSNALDDAAELAPDGLLQITPTPETVWWPDPDPLAAEETMQIYRDFIG